MKKEILESIIDLKKTDDPQAKIVKERLERALNREMIETLSLVYEIGKEIGYKNVQDIIKGVGELADALERGKFEWNK